MTSKPSSELEPLIELLTQMDITKDQRKQVTATVQQVLQTTQTKATNERLAANDEARTLATVLKPTKPKPYHGEIDAVACLNFIENQEEYFEIVGLNKTMWVKYTSVSLEDDAKAWWRDSGMNMNTVWEEFHDAFIKYHTPPNAVAAARQELDKLRQKHLSVKEYTHRFRRLSRLIPNMDPDTTLFIYMNGLEPETSKEVRLRQPETMGQAVQQASIVHGILHPTPPTVLATSAPTPAQPPAQPMELDAIRTLLTGLTNIANLTSAATTVSHFSQPLGKLTQAEKERLLKIGACFRCRRRGHRAVECRAGQTLNNLETDNQSNDSGKDQGGM